MIQEWEYRVAFRVMGISVICLSSLTVFLKLNGYAGFLCGSDAPGIHLRRRRSQFGGSNESSSSGIPNSQAETQMRNGKGMTSSTA